MSWYDLFAHVYDGMLERVYRDHRIQAADALRLEPGQTVIDVGCGTGASFAELIQRVGPEGRVIGVDASSGMLRRANARVEAAGWGNVELLEAKVDDASAMKRLLDRVSEADALQFFLSLSVIEGWDEVLRSYVSRSSAGTRVVIADVHNPKPGPYARYVEFVSRGQLERKSWELLEELSSEFALEWPPCSWTLGGRMFVASALR